MYCKKCHSFVYVGETGNTLYQRHLLNFSRIRTRHSDLVADHFYTNIHDVADFWVMGLEKLNGSDIYRKTMEQLWKNKLRTYLPFSINSKEQDGKARQYATSVGARAETTSTPSTLFQLY